jgi:hypothetical protein
MSAQHTPGPWFVVDTGTNGAAPSGCEISIDDREGGNPERDYFLVSVVHGDPDELLANARRIVSCVNALEGLPQEALDAGWTSLGLSQHAARLETANKELLEELEELVAEARRCDSWESFPDEPLEKARAAIAKARGAQ